MNIEMYMSEFSAILKHSLLQVADRVNVLEVISQLFQTAKTHSNSKGKSS